MPKLRVEKVEEINGEVVINALRKALQFTSAIQAHDGHWPSELGSPIFFIPLLVSYIQDSTHGMDY